MQPVTSLDLETDNPPVVNINLSGAFNEEMKLLVIPGQQIVVSASENPTTGYKWQY